MLPASGADFHVELGPGGGHVRVVILKPFTVELGRDCGRAAAEVGVQHGVYRYLFDTRQARNVDSVTANYRFAHMDLSAFRFSKSVPVAVLTRPGDRSYDFMETALTNAGYRVRLFSREDEAVQWLEGTAPA
jgi:hypothetical protein